MQMSLISGYESLHKPLPNAVVQATQSSAREQENLVA